MRSSLQRRAFGEHRGRAACLRGRVCASVHVWSDVRGGAQQSGVAVRTPSVLGAESRRRRRAVEVGVRDCAYMAGGGEKCSVQKCKNVLRFGNVGALAGGDWMVLAADAVSNATEEAERTGVQNRLKCVEDGELISAFSELREMFEKVSGAQSPCGEAEVI